MPDALANLEFLEQQLGVKERVVIIFNGPLNPTMRPDSPGMWRTRIAIKAEVPRQKSPLGREILLL